MKQKPSPTVSGQKVKQKAFKTIQLILSQPGSDCESIPSEKIDEYAQKDAEPYNEGKSNSVYHSQIAPNGGACAGYMSSTFVPPAEMRGYLETMGNQSIGTLLTLGDEVFETDINDNRATTVLANFQTDRIQCET
jgi:hypothetical protein